MRPNTNTLNKNNGFVCMLVDVIVGVTNGCWLGLSIYGEFEIS